MAREITTAVATASAQSHVVVAMMARMEFGAGTVYVNSTPGPIDTGGATYLGMGALGKLSPVEETSELKATGISFELSGVDPSLISIALNEQYQGRPVAVLLALLDASHQLIADPVCVWSGQMDTMSIELAETGKISVACENKMMTWERPRIRRYNDEDQKARYPGDRGLEFVPGLQDKELGLGARMIEAAALRRLARREGWEGRLALTFEAWREMPFVWGRNDCVLFAARCVKALTGEDLAADLGRWENADQAYRRLAQVAHIRGPREDMLTLVVSRRLGPPLPKVLQAARGDVVLVDGDFGPGLGIVALDGRRIVAPGVAGLAARPLRQGIRAWSIG